MSILKMVLRAEKTLKTTIQKNLPKSQKFTRKMSVAEFRYSQNILLRFTVILFDSNMVEKLTRNEEKVTSNEHKITSNKEKVTSNEQNVTSNEQKIASNKQSITSNEQKVTSNEQKATSSEQIVISNEQKVTRSEQKVQPLFYSAVVFQRNSLNEKLPSENDLLNSLVASPL